MLYKFPFGLVIIVCLIFTFSACNSNKQNPSVSPGKGLNDSTNAFTADSFAYYEHVLIADSSNSALRIALATNYYADKQFDKAIGHLLQVYRADNKNLEVLITLGNVYYDTEQYVEAADFYEKALSIDNKNTNVRCDLATCYLNLKNPDKACTLLKKNIEMDDKHAQSHHNLSVVYNQLGKIKEAEEEMKIFNTLSR
jgi:Tfp pilus assembly protein PilF